MRLKVQQLNCLLEMKYSVVLPTFLGEYKGAASNRDKKLVRAINSVYSQTFKDFELVVVCDGCEESYQIVTKNFPQAKCLLIEKQPVWSGQVRNVGIQNAKGEYILYIDNDDVWGKEHLEKINSQTNGADWVFFNDFVLQDGWIERQSSIRLGHCGTSNICHKREGSPLWGSGYAHDYYFILNLQKKSKPKSIDAAEYFVCHIPNIYDL